MELRRVVKRVKDNPKMGSNKLIFLRKKSDLFQNFKLKILSHKEENTGLILNDLTRGIDRDRLRIRIFPL